MTVPERGENCEWDSELQGFGVRVQPGGHKTYIVRYRTKDANRTQRKMVLCPTSHATPEKAKQLARDVFLAVAAGGDPAAERSKKKAAGNEVTLEQMFKARVAYMKSKNLAITSEVERVLLKAKHNAADFMGKDRPPSSITPDDVIKFVKKHFDEGNRGAADKARSYLSATFSWAISSANDYTVKERKDWGVKHNPAADVAKDSGASGTRNRALQANEIKILWDACQGGNVGFSEGTEVLLRLIIACGQRVQESLRVEGKEIDLDKKVWAMPKEKTKGQTRDHGIPLPDIIIPDLRRLKEKYGDGYLFPARSDSAIEILGAVSISHAVRRTFESKNRKALLPIEPFQPRDLRRTWKSRAGDGARVDRETRDIIQQHSKSDTGSKHYDWADYLPQMREGMEKWNAWLETVINSDPPTSAALDIAA